MDIRERLIELGEEKNGDFQSMLTPGVERDRFLGVRVPALRSLAKQISGTPECREFLDDLPHRYYDEDLLHAILLCGIKDFGECMERVEEFLPYIDNWAVCDTLHPAVFRKNRGELLKRVREWICSGETYTVRYAVGMLMTYFLDDGFFDISYSDMVAGVQSGEYYVDMMCAWYFATALAKQWDRVIGYITQRKLPIWVHNKTIRKAIESYRISPEHKQFLRGETVKTSKK